MLRKSARIHLCSMSTVPACSLLIFVVCVCLLSLTQPAYAEISWSGDITPGDPTKWTIYTSGYVGQTGIGSIKVNGDSDLESGAIYIGKESSSTGEVTVDGAGSTWTNNIFLYVGHSGSGTLSITDGAVVSGYASSHIGYDSGSTGEVIVDGAGTAWNNGSLRVGSKGNGLLSITNAAAVNSSSVDIGSNSNLTAEVTVNGVGSMWTISKDLYVGQLGSGTLSITGGATVSNSDGWIAYFSGSTSEVTVDGAGSTWTNSNGLFVGYWGNGTLNITNDAVVSADYTSVAYWPNTIGLIDFGSGGGTLITGSLRATSTQLTGTGTIDTHHLISDVDLVFDSSHGLKQTLLLNSLPDQNITINLDMSDELAYDMYAGYQSNGSLSVLDGVSVNSASGYIGYDSSSKGNVIVDGAGSTWTNNNDLYVGYNGNGAMSISNDAIVCNPSLYSFAYIGHSSRSTGTVTVSGSNTKWINGGFLCVGNDGSGTLCITDGATVSNDASGLIGRNHSAMGEVTVDGAGSMWINGDWLSVGLRGSGTLNITNGGLVSVARTLIIDEIGVGNSSIRITTGGMLALHGDGGDSLDEFLGMIDGTGAIRYWDDSISDWADISGATRGEDYTLSYIIGGNLDGYTLLSVGAPNPGVTGDANHDGVVNHADAAVMATYWLTASGATWEMGDFNDDGAVDEIDATLLAANWHSNVDEQGVPEPTVLVGLLGLALAGMLRVGRVRKH